MTTETWIAQPPADLISHVEFHPINNNYILASSWDGCSYIYDFNDPTEQLEAKFDHKNPVLSCCFQDSYNFAIGNLDGFLLVYDIKNNKEHILGCHDDAINCVEYCPTLGVFVTGSWDQFVKIWDPREESSQNQITLPQNSKVYTIAMCDQKVIVGTSERKVNVWDLRTRKLDQCRDSVLKYQTRQIKTFPDKRGFVLSSIEGRVAVEYLDMSPEIQKNKYAFKCHRIKDDANCSENVYPVNAIAFHKQYSTFATGGSDGYVYIWDAYNKKRLCNFPRYPNQIVSLAFSHDDKYLAIASSHLHDIPPGSSDTSESQSTDNNNNNTSSKDKILNDKLNRIFVREVTDKETKPR